MQFVDTAPVSGTRMTKDGYLVADVRVARTGIQQYLAREIGLNRDGIVNVYRPEETVFSKDSMATSLLVPFSARRLTPTRPNSPPATHPRTSQPILPQRKSNCNDARPNFIRSTALQSWATGTSPTRSWAIASRPTSQS